MPKPAILSLTELMKLKGSQKTPLVVYFDKEEWKALKGSLRKAKEGNRPGKAVTLTLATLPALPGGLVEIDCAEGTLRIGKQGELIPGGLVSANLCTLQFTEKGGKFNLPGGRCDCVGKCVGLGAPVCGLRKTKKDQPGYFCTC